MIEHRDRRSGESWEPLSEHATFRLGIDYGFRHSFNRGQPVTQGEYEAFRSHSAYFVAPPYEEYLQLYDMYTETCRLRATGLSEIEAAEAVRRRFDQEKT
jgi:hypothetical protein